MLLSINRFQFSAKNILTSNLIYFEHKKAGADLYRKNKLHWVTSIPATFITAISVSYILYEPNMGFGIDIDVSNIVGVVSGLVCLFLLLKFGKKPIAGDPEAETTVNE